jgi:hypothetical protein
MANKFNSDPRYLKGAEMIKCVEKIINYKKIFRNQNIIKESYNRMLASLSSSATQTGNCQKNKEIQK